MSRGQESMGPVSGVDLDLTLTIPLEVRTLPQEMAPWCPGEDRTDTQGTEARTGRRTGHPGLRPWVPISTICVG